MTSDKENKTVKNFLKQLLSFVLLWTKTPFFVLFCPSAITVKKKTKQTQTGLWLLNNNFLYLLARKKKLLFFVHAKSFKSCLFFAFPSFCLFYCCSSETKGKEFSFCDETNRTNNKGGQAIKEVFLFSVHCWCFFSTDGNVFVF